MEENSKAWFPIWGINGEAGHGKDLVADWIATEKNFAKIALADPMKRFVMGLLNFTVEELWGPSEIRNTPVVFSQDRWMQAIARFPVYGNEFLSQVAPGNVNAFLSLMAWLTKLRKENPEQLSARTTLQTLGTEWGRDTNPVMWLQYFDTISQEISGGGFSYDQTQGLVCDPGKRYSGIVIPDKRFLNELKWDYRVTKGGLNFRVRRLSKVVKDGSNTGIPGHRSELEQRGIPDEEFDWVFNFEEGLDKVHADLKLAFYEEPWRARKKKQLTLTDDLKTT